MESAILHRLFVLNSLELIYLFVGLLDRFLDVKVLMRKVGSLTLAVSLVGWPLERQVKIDVQGETVVRLVGHQLCLG